MNYFKINGRSYNVVVTELTESFTILYSENSGRTMAVGSRMVLDPLGTYIAHNVKVKRKAGYEEDFDELYEFFLQPRYDGVKVEIAHLQDSISYDAYVSNGSRTLTRIDPNKNKAYWGELTLNIVPMEAQILP